MYCMESMFFSVIREDCQVVSSSQKKNGLLEIVMPKSYDNKKLLEYIKGFGVEKYNEIVGKQKENKEVFQKKIKKMLDKYKKEFNLPFLIRLRVQAKTKKYVDWDLKIQGVIFECNLLMDATLQYRSDEELEKIIRYYVYEIACEYENLYSRINGVTTEYVNIIDHTIEKNYYTEIPKEKKYVVTAEASEIQKLKSEYELTIMQICIDIEKKPILAVG